MSKEQYDGDYKVEISDKGRVSLNLNWKWLAGAIISVLGFIGYLLVDEYLIEPLQEKEEQIIELKEDIEKEKALNNEERNKNREILNVLTKNQSILLDRSERTDKILTTWVNGHGGFNNTEETPINTEIPVGMPGGDDAPETEENP